MGAAKHRILPDMIEIGSFIGMAAITGSEVTIKDVAYDDLGIIPDTFSRLGIQLERRGDDIYTVSYTHLAKGDEKSKLRYFSVSRCVFPEPAEALYTYKFISSSNDA